MAHQNEQNRSLTRGKRRDLCVQAKVGHWCRKLMLLILDEYMGQNDHCWPSIPTLCDKAESGKRTVQRAISELVALGIVRYDDGKPGIASRVYEIDYRRLAEFYHDGGDHIVSEEWIAEQLAEGLRDDKQQSNDQDEPMPMRHGSQSPAHASQAWDPRQSGTAPMPEPMPEPMPVRHPKQTDRTMLNQSVEPTVAQRAANGTVCVSVDPAERKREIERAGRIVRQRQRATEALRSAGVWDKEIGDLLVIAGKQPDGTDGEPKGIYIASSSRSYRIDRSNR